jgi:MFS family permease
VAILNFVLHASHGPHRPSSKDWYCNLVQVIFFWCYALNQWSRYLLNYLYPIDNSPDTIGQLLSPSQYGFLVGYGYTIIFAIFTIAVGLAVDRFNRVIILTSGVLLWSLATTSMGIWAQGFGGLLVCRIFVAAGQSTTNPVSYSLIADIVPPQKRSTANGIFAAALYVGGALSSLSILIAEQLGWRDACYIVGSIGIGIGTGAACALTEPSRKRQGAEEAQWGAEQSHTKSQMLEKSVRMVCGSPLVMLISFSSGVRFMAGFAIAGFLPKYFAVAYPDYTSLYSILNATVVSIGGAFSSYAGGWIADKWGLRTSAACMYVPMLGSILAVPFLGICLYSSNFFVAMSALMLEYLVAECWFGPVIGALQLKLNSRTRGLGLATFTLVTNLIGSLMPSLMGEFLAEDESAKGLRSAIFFGAGSSYVTCAALFGLASLHFRRPVSDTVDPQLLLDSPSNSSTRSL